MKLSDETEKRIRRAMMDHNELRSMGEEIENLKCDVCDARGARNQAEHDLDDERARSVGLWDRIDRLRGEVRRMKKEQAKGNALHDAIRREVGPRLRKEAEFIRNGVIDNAVEDIVDALNIYKWADND